MPTALQKGLKIQAGAEVTWGTIVPATTILPGLESIEYGPMDTLEEPDELNGILAATTDGPDVLGTAGGLRTPGFLTYQGVLYLLEAGYHTATPSADAGAPTPAQTRVYAPGLTAEKTAQSRSFEAGGLTEAFVFPGTVLQNYSWSTALKEYTRFDANWIAQDMIAQAFTAALTRQTVRRILGQRWVVTMDTTWAGLGTTDITSCLTAIAFDSGPLQEHTNCINGATTPNGVVQNTAGRPTVTLTFKQDAATAALFANYRAGDMRFLRLLNTGTVAIHGTPDVFPSLQYDLAAAIVEWPRVGGAVTEQSLTIALPFVGRYDTTSGKMLETTSVTALATIP